MLNKEPRTEITHLVLSGGLGNSAYVQRKLKEKYHLGANCSLPNAQKLRLRVAPDPELCVAMGLVEDKLQKYLTEKFAVGWRCCSVSYGIVCQEKYDPSNPNHLHLRKSKDKGDGHGLVNDVVKW